MLVLRTNTRSYAGFASGADRTGGFWDESLWATVAFAGAGFCFAQKQTQHISVSNTAQLRTKASTWSRLRAQAATHCSSCIVIINKGSVREGCTSSSWSSEWIFWHQQSKSGAGCWGHCAVAWESLWMSPSMQCVQGWSSLPSALLPPFPAHMLLLPLKREPLSQADVNDKAPQWTHHHFRLIGDGPLGQGVCK